MEVTITAPQPTAIMANFVSTLFESRDQAHVFHLQSTSLSQHKALNEYYDEIVELIDGLVESVSGIYGNPKGYDVEDLEDFVSKEQVLAYFTDLYKYVQSEREGLYKESWIQNQIDEVVELIAHTIYLLKLQ